MNVESRSCPACNKTVKGRADKRFCDDYCRNNYNNQLNSDSVNYVRNVNNILRRNRRILEETMKGIEKATIRTKVDLAKKGYRFEFFTSIFTNKEKETYYYCYEFGFKEIDREKCIIVRNKTQKLVEPGVKG
jgi:predicted nucleic acid-binding Zn ribbon protein